MPTQLQCIVVTPEETLREGKADFVAVTLDDGELGVAPGHAPMIGRLGIGEIRITLGLATDRYYAEGGFVEVLDNVVSILTPRAIPVEELSEMHAVEALDQARSQPSNTPELMAARDDAVRRARAMLHAARRAGQ